VRDFNELMPALEKIVAHAIKTLDYSGHQITQPPQLNTVNHKNIGVFGENIKTTNYQTKNLAVQGYSAAALRPCGNSSEACVYHHVDLRRSNGDPSGLYHDENLYTTIKIKDRPWSLKLRVKGLEMQTEKVSNGVIHQSYKTSRPYELAQAHVDIAVAPSFCKNGAGADDIEQQVKCVIAAIPFKKNKKFHSKSAYVEEVTLADEGHNIAAKALYYSKSSYHPNGEYKGKILNRELLFRKSNDWIKVRGYMHSPVTYLAHEKLADMHKYLSIINIDQ
jgi:hypothetical protein